MTRSLRLAVAGLLAATACATPVATAEATAESGVAETASARQAQRAVGADRAARFMDRYLRQADRGEWRWVRQHSTRRMKKSVPTLRANADHGRYGRHGRCWGYEDSDQRTCTYTLSGEPMGEIGVRRRLGDRRSIVASGHSLYS